MDHLKIEMGYELLEKILRNLGNFSDVKVEKSDNSMKIIFINKLMGIVRIPISIKFKLKRTQETPDDPLVFEVEAMPMVKKVLEEHSGKFYEYKGGDIEVFPKKFSQILSKLVISSVEFMESSIVLKLRPYEYSE
jgi:hypothetical protein